MEKQKLIAKSFAKRFILNRQYQLLAEDFATDESVIELIFKDVHANEIVFIPIRVTNNREFLLREEVKNYFKRRKIAQNVKWYLTKHGLLNEQIRVDFAEVSVDGDKAKLRYSMKVIY